MGTGRRRGDRRRHRIHGRVVRCRLAFDDSTLVAHAKLGILVASLAAALLSATLLAFTTRPGHCPLPREKPTLSGPSIDEAVR